MEVLTPEEYAERYKLNVQTVRRMCKSGAIKAEQFGTAWRIPVFATNTEQEVDLEALANQLEALKTSLEDACEAFRTAADVVEKWTLNETH